MQWERLQSNRFEVYRTAVPGGWLVVVQSETAISFGSFSTLTFIPDAEHQWDGKSLPMNIVSADNTPNVQG
jgi:hypothetical protein